MKPYALIAVTSLALSGPAVLSFTATAASDTEAATPMMPMMGRMQAMREQMAKLHETKDPEQRKKLLEEHMGSMQDMMKMMHGMMQSEGMMSGRGGMMGQGMMQGGMMGKPQQGGTTGQGMMGGRGPLTMKRMDMMEERMNTMQLLMDQMLENQSQALKSEKK